jgi:hypothetical protein
VTWRVAIVPDALVDGIALQIVESGGGHTQQLWFGSRSMQTVEPGNAMPSPSLTVDDELGRALLDALAEHYGHTSGGRQQRADFEHERRRVDKLVDHLMRAQTAQPPGASA